MKFYLISIRTRIKTKTLTWTPAFNILFYLISIRTRIKTLRSRYAMKPNKFYLISIRTRIKTVAKLTALLRVLSSI